MQLLPRLRLFVARHPAYYWIAVVVLAAAAAWLVGRQVDRQVDRAARARAACEPISATPDPTTRDSDDLGPPRAGEVAVPLHAIPGVAAGTRVRVYSLGSAVADGRVVEVLDGDVLVAVSAADAGAVSLAASEGTAQLGLLGRDGRG